MVPIWISIDKKHTGWSPENMYPVVAVDVRNKTYLVPDDQGKVREVPIADTTVRSAQLPLNPAPAKPAGDGEEPEKDRKSGLIVGVSSLFGRKPQ